MCSHDSGRNFGLAFTEFLPQVFLLPSAQSLLAVREQNYVSLFLMMVVGVGGGSPSTSNSY